jgi:hypothetical protein
MLPSGKAANTIGMIQIWRNVMRCFIRYDTLFGLVLFFLCGCAATASENQDVSSPVQAPPARHAPDRQQESPWEFIYGRYISDTQILEMVSVHGSNPEHPTVLLAFDAGGAGNRVALSHDKQFFAYTRIPQQVSVHTRNAAELWVVNRETRDVRKMTDQVAVGRYTNYPLWSPDDQMIAFYRTTARIPPYEQHIVLIDRETVQETTLISQSVQLQESEGSDFIYPLDWSPDGQYLYYQRGKYGVVTLWRIAADGNHAPEQIGTLSEAGTPRCYHL